MSSPSTVIPTANRLEASRLNTHDAERTGLFVRATKTPVVGIIGGIGSGKSSVARRLQELSRRRSRSATRIPSDVDRSTTNKTEPDNAKPNASHGVDSPTIAIIDADQLGHQVLQLPTVIDRLCGRFGDAVIEYKHEAQSSDSASAAGAHARSHALRGNAIADAPRPEWMHDAERQNSRSHAERGSERDKPAAPASESKLPEISRSALARLVFGSDPASQQARRDLEQIVWPEIRSLAERQIHELRQQDEVEAILLDAAVLLEAGWDSACDLVIFIDTPDAIRLARVQAGRGWTAEELAKREASQWPLARKRAAANVIIDNSKSVDDAAKHLKQVLLDLKSEI